MRIGITNNEIIKLLIEDLEKRGFLIKDPTKIRVIITDGELNSIEFDSVEYNARNIPVESPPSNPKKDGKKVGKFISPEEMESLNAKSINDLMRQNQGLIEQGPPLKGGISDDDVSSILDDDGY